MEKYHDFSELALARMRLDKVMIDRGLVPSRERARGLIMAGVVEVAGIAR